MTVAAMNRIALDDRARLKERDENVRFKQSMTHHVSHEGLVPRKLEANGDASRFVPRLVGFVCGCGSCGDLFIEPLRRPADRDPRVVHACAVIAGKPSTRPWPLRLKQRTHEPSRRTHRWRHDRFHEPRAGRTVPFVCLGAGKWSALRRPP